MLQRLFRREPALALRFQRRECVIVPQTPSRVALHADVHFTAAAAGGREARIEDARLVWRSDAGAKAVLRRSQWDRAVIQGRFRYPPQALLILVGAAPVEVTLTFTDPLIPHGAEAPPPTSRLELELTLSGGHTWAHDLWRVSMASWDGAAVEWVGSP